MLQGIHRFFTQSAFRRQDSWILSAFILCALAACTLVIGISAIPVTDRDEPRFAQASRQMAEGDSLADWIVPRVGDEIRLKKPPLIYWMQAPVALAATGGDLTRDAIWMYRLPSVMAALVAAFATLWLGRAMFGGNVGLLAACMLVVSPVIAVDCHMARADELLLATTSLAMCVLWSLWRTHRRDPFKRGGLPLATCILFWLFIGLGVLAKGPITPFVAGTTAAGVAIARREWRFLLRLRPFLGLLVLLALALPWVWLAKEFVGWETLRAAFEKEVLLRAREGAEGHAAPPGYYLVTLVVFFFPGSLLTALAFGRMFVRGFAAQTAVGAGFFARTRTRLLSTRGRDAEVFLLSWAVPTWLAFEIVVTKFPHYILPIYPAIALFTARCVLGGTRALPKPLNAGDRFGFGVWMVIGIILALAGPALWIFLVGSGRTASVLPSWPQLDASTLLEFGCAAVATMTSVVLLVMAWRAAIHGGFSRAMVLAIPAAALAEIALFSTWLPNMRWIWNTPRIVGLVAQDCGLTPESEDFPRIGGVGYQEDSLLWATRNRLDRLGNSVTDANRSVIENWCRANPGGYLLIPRAHMESFTAFGSVVGEVHGFNYSDGDPLEHAVLRIK
jgi:4-amino-4-deoxy-L-arabinose transferase-like glycosyltransferase